MEKNREYVSLFGEVLRVKAEPTKARAGDYRYSGIELKAEASGARIFIIFPDYCGADFVEVPKLCWPGARIAAYDISYNNCLEDGSLIYGVNPDSQIVLEPCRPVSVIEAVESFKCLRSIDLRHRFRNEEPFWLAKGKAIHTLFDHLVGNPLAPTDTLFDRSFSSVVGEFVEALPGSSTTVTYKDFRNELKKHHKNLASWIFGRFGKDYEADTELDKISVRYGLKGRADAVFYLDKSVTVLEIKSGKIPSEDHLLQLNAYNMLILEDDPNQDIDSHVVYSLTGLSKKAGDVSVRTKRSILQGRNRFIALKRFHAFRDNLCDPDAIVDCNNQLRCFSKANCDAVYGSNIMLETILNPAQRKYYDTWFTLISIDEWMQESDFAMVLDQTTLNSRIEDGITIALETLSIECDSNQSEKNSMKRDLSGLHPMVGGQNRLLHYKPTSILLESSNGLGDFNEGDEVIIHSGDVCARDSIRARISEIVENRLRLVTKIDDSRLKQKLEASNPDDRKWYIDKVPFLRAREMFRKNLLSFFTNAEKTVVETVVANVGESVAESQYYQGDIKCKDSASSEPAGYSRPMLVTHDSSTGLDTSADRGLAELNERQRIAVTKSLDAPVFHLVHGPPGTGKTRVLSRLIHKLIQRDQRVLVACPTNVALDRVLIALIKIGFYDFIRIGSRYSCTPEFVNAANAAGANRAHLDQTSARTRDFNEFRNVVNNTKLIGATAYQCASNPLFLKQRFDIVVIDEAGQLDEPATLAPLSMSRRFILCGDHLQLPPVVQNRKNRLNNCRSHLEVSLFERLFATSPPENISTLNVQYRMNTEVQEIPSNLFYGGTLLAAPEVAGRRLRLRIDLDGPACIKDIIDPDSPVVLADVQGGADMGKARPEEAEVAFEIVLALTEAGVDPSDIGIITPYRAQQSLIRQKLGRLTDCSEISVDTVDSFQGGEREIIIISLARADSVTSFLADPKRLNVSLSRARSKLILLGRASVLQEHHLFNAICSGLKKVVINK